MSYLTKNLMSIITKVKLIEQLFSQLEKETISFKLKASLDCVGGCGKCCSNTEIEASPLEFLPWAFHIFVSGKAYEVINQLNNLPNSECFLYHHLSLIENGLGSCSDYYHRGLICRLFGNAASRNKYGKLEIVTCKIIKDLNPDKFALTSGEIKVNNLIPVFTEYYMRLSQIDFSLGNVICPINLAMKLSIEEILNYYSYHPFHRRLKSSA